MPAQSTIDTLRDREQQIPRYSEFRRQIGTEEEIYTKWGYDYCNEATFTSILLKHYPEMAYAVEGVFNVSSNCMSSPDDIEKI